MAISLLIFETHPIQYRAPVYSRLNQICPGQIHVAYACDISLRGGLDPGFSLPVTWDGNLMGGYPSTVLDASVTLPPRGWNDLRGHGVISLIHRLQPRAILLNSLNYRYDHTAYLAGLLARIPIWMRCETQDQAFSRSWLKDRLRHTYYRLLYAGIQQAFPIGELNRQHWLRHGMKPMQLRAAHYCTPNRAAALTTQQRQCRREALRQQLGLDARYLLVGFFGKLIPKKDPMLLLESLPLMPDSLRHRLAFVYVGSGALQQELQQEAAAVQLRYGVPVHFPGFVNQSALVDWYLAADVVVLPSQRTGETWGLVVNEAMQAGCSVVVSEAVGCTADFSGWERFRTIPVGSASSLALALMELAEYPRSFTWATEGLQPYSIEAAAQAFAAAIAELP
ncbi:glycosyltransferase family 4 protein [Synechococcus sp. CBW1002]|uniref:glycosyltransferase family 4 protein n=1 Tax=Synechococcus sp. CBW1002 TaxID=1353134 RepID=UPI0018CE65B3|nr:glycosyltransferase [Synechococcus sp. CBW1002]QPN59120.1 glycosyltransferase family 4 protein [Synechococcus sp. CBW1002]